MRPHIGGLHPRVIPKKDSVWLDFRGRHDRFLEFLSEHKKQQVAHHRHHTHTINVLMPTRHTKSHTLSDSSQRDKHARKTDSHRFHPRNSLYLLISPNFTAGTAIILRSCFCATKVLRKTRILYIYLSTLLRLFFSTPTGTACLYEVLISCF